MSRNYTKHKRQCFVPMCLNSTTKTPTKLFFKVPTIQEIREKWFKSVNRAMNETEMFCCSDHFNVSFFGESPSSKG